MANIVQTLKRAFRGRHKTRFAIKAAVCLFIGCLAWVLIGQPTILDKIVIALGVSLLAVLLNGPITWFVKKMPRE